MDDLAVFTNLMRNTLVVNTQQMNYVVKNVLGKFGELLDVDDEYIDTFVKDAHSVNNDIAVAQIILIRNNITQGLKSMFLS